MNTKGSVQKKKRKKNVEFSTSRYFTPRPVKMWKFILFFFTIFLDVLAHFKHIRKTNIFPLEKLKTLRFFWGSSEEAGPDL